MRLRLGTSVAIAVETARAAAATGDSTLTSTGAGHFAAARAGGVLATATVQSELRSGKTRAETATAPGRTAADPVTALDTEVSAGTITSAQQTTLLDNLTARLPAVANGTSGSRGTWNELREDLARLA
jgi:hypothetical protein